ncbi:MAG: VWA domain-containing protein [Pseudomonadota bacterium]
MKYGYQRAVGLLVLLASGFSSAAESTSAGGSGPRDTAIVLDASGSMWGQIDGISKMAIAQEVLSDMLEDWPVEQRLAVTVYGHRSEGDCDDIESIIDLGTVDKTRVREALSQVRPKGKTPLTAAVQQAAAGLSFTEQPATVILVSDGLENCGLDPCQIAAELEAQGVDFTAHVIGFDVGKEDTANLRCLADQTGGTYATADNASALSGALEEVVEETRTDPIRLVAVLEAGGEPLTKGVSWEVQAPDADFEGKHEVLWRSGAPQAKVDLDNGVYRIVARRGATRVPVVAEIDDTTRQIEVVLGAGDIRLQATLGEGTEVLTRRVNWRVFEPEPDFDGKYKRVASSGAAQAKFTLPAGTYRVEVNRDNTRLAVPISVVGGEQKLHVISLGAADLKAVATLGPEGRQLTRQMTWRVESVEADFDGNYERIASTGAGEPTFTLPAGQYRLVARRGEAEHNRVVELGSGERKRVVVPLEAGEIIATAHLAAGTPALKRVSWQVQQAEADFDGNYQRVMATGADEPRLTLASGSYRLVPSRGYASGAHVIEVTTGSQKRHEVIMNAGELRAGAVDAQGNPVTRGLSWAAYSVDPEQGSEQRMGATGAPTPMFTLPAGEYRIEAKTRGGRAEQNVTVAPGQQQALELTISQ